MMRGRKETVELWPMKRCNSEQRKPGKDENVLKMMGKECWGGEITGVKAQNLKKNTGSMRGPCCKM